MRPMTIGLLVCLAACGPHTDPPADELPGNATPDAGNTPPPGPANLDVRVTITADNAYGFGYGTQAALAHYFEGVEDGGSQVFYCSAACDDETPCAGGLTCDAFGTCNGDSMGPETYIVPASATQGVEYLYVVTWSDEWFTQGLIAQFASSDGETTIYTGDPAWEVCATGRDYYYGSGGPTQEVISEYLAKCSLTPDATYSNGWVGTTPNANNQALVVLPPTSEMQFPNFDKVCGRNAAEAGRGDALDAEAKWIWFDDNVLAYPSAFESRPGDENPRGDFLIFRLPLETVTPVS